jgi:hypothetical protein
MRMRPKGVRMGKRMGRRRRNDTIDEREERNKTTPDSVRESVLKMQVRCREETQHEV